MNDMVMLFVSLMHCVKLVSHRKVVRVITLTKKIVSKFWTQSASTHTAMQQYIYSHQ